MNSDDERDRKDITPIVCLVILLVFGSLGVGLMAISVSVDNDNSNNVETRGISIKGEINGDHDHVAIIQISGSTLWTDYRMIVKDGQNYTDLETRTIESYPGDSIYFTGPEFHPENGIEYNIKIIHIGDNMVVWDKDILAE